MVSILKQGRTLIASIQSSLTDSQWEQFRAELLKKVGAAHASGVIVDVAAMDVVDSFASRTLRDLCQMLKLRGAQAVIVGIQPEVAFAMVQLGLKMEGVPTALDLEVGLDLLKELVEGGRGNG